MPSSVVFSLITLSVLKLFTISLTACGSLIKTITSIKLNIKKQSRKKVKNGVIKLPATLTAPPLNSVPLCSTSTFQTIIHFILSFSCTKHNSLMNPSAGDWPIPATFHLPVTELLLKLQGWNVPKESVTARKVLAVAVNRSFHSLAATGDGILPEINIFLLPSLNVCCCRFQKRSSRFSNACPLYEYCKTNGITPFIGLNPDHMEHFKYKDDKRWCPCLQTRLTYASRWCEKSKAP